jgi:hypothetical protein
MADDIIERHRRRLEEHKGYLATGASATAVAAPTAAFQQQHHRPIDSHQPTADKSPRGRLSPTAALMHGNAASPSLSHTSDGGRYFTPDPARLFERTTRWAANRDRAIVRSLEEREGRALDGCTFRPMTHHTDRTFAREASSMSSEPLKDTSSIQQHVQRQECARRGRDELQRRGNVDTSAWSPRTTVPKAFNLGRRSDRPISALRKPVAAAFGVESTEGDEAAASAAPCSGGDPPFFARSHDSSSTAEREGPLHSRIAQQEMEIAKLNGTIASLRRELDVAKAKVRQLALAGGAPPAL